MSGDEQAAFRTLVALAERRIEETGVSDPGQPAKCVVVKSVDGWEILIQRTPK